MDYEGQICRAPMERASFMLPVMVGCSYNRCKFCTLFRHLKYRELPLEQVEAELIRVKEVGGKPPKIFLGDGNAFGQSMQRLEAILGMIASYFPECKTINMDATVGSIKAKSDEELRWLAQAGVSHLYLGIESGLPDVLRFMNKDHEIDDAKLQIARLHDAGMHYAAHIMTGVAGAGRSEENALALAAFLNETHPAYVVNFSMFLHTEAPLFEEVHKGNFVPATELENLQEERVLVENLYTNEEGGRTLKYDGFHDFVGERVRGNLPQDREKMLAKLDALIGEFSEEPAIYSCVYGQCPNFLDLEGKNVYQGFQRICRAS